MLAWGWRVPLLLSVVLVLFGLWLRIGVTETPQFRDIEQRGARTRAPLGEVIRHHWRGLLIGGGARIGPDVMYSLVAVFSLTYITTILGLSRGLAVTALSIGAACNAVLILAAGVLSDRFGRRAVYGAGVAAALVWTWVLFPLLDSKLEWAITLAVVSGLAIHAFMYGPQGAFIAEQFPTEVRYAGASLAYTFAGVFAGGIAPLVFTALYRSYRHAQRGRAVRHRRLIGHRGGVVCLAPQNGVSPHFLKRGLTPFTAQPDRRLPAWRGTARHRLPPADQRRSCPGWGRPQPRPRTSLRGSFISRSSMAAWPSSWRRFSALQVAASIDVSGITTTNSSPPQRHTTSAARTFSVNRRLT